MPRLLSKLNSLLNPVSLAALCLFCVTSVAVVQNRAQFDGENNDLLAPSNDNFANAQVVSSSFLSFTNVGATKEPGEPNHAGFPGGASIWFKWTASTSGGVAFRGYMDNFNLDIVMAVYTGASVNALTVIAYNDNEELLYTPSDVGFYAVAGTTYYIAVDVKNGTGTGSLTQRSAPDHDTFSQSVTISGGSGSIPADCGNATRQGGEPSHNATAEFGSVWYSWTATSSQAITFYVTSFSSAPYEGLGVYTGNSVGALTHVSGNVGKQIVSFNPVVGTTYRIAVNGNTNSLLNWVPPPSNDNFANSKTISGVTGSESGSNVGASREPGEPNSGTSGATIWYSWTAPATGTFLFEQTGGDFVSAIAVFTGSSINALTRVSVLSPSFNRVVFNATVGTTYRIVLDGYFASITGVIVFRWTPTPANDNFANAQVINGNDGTILGTLDAATGESGEPSQPERSVWYSWTAPIAGLVSFGLPAQSFLFGGAYTGTSVNSLTTVATTGASNPPSITFNVLPGTTYKIQIAGSSASILNFALTWHVTPAPSNDFFANAQILTGSSVNLLGNNLAASMESGEPLHGGQFATFNSIWYRWTAPTNVSVYIDTHNSVFPTVLAVYTGATVDALTQVASASNFPNSVQFNAIGGTTYHIAIASSFTGGGDVSLNFNAASRPANDNFANSQTLSNSSGSASGSNVGATLETGEPTSGSSTIWYSWTAATSAKVEFNTFNSGFDTELYIFTGNSLASLTLIKYNDNAANTPQSRVVFDALSGTTYRICIGSNFVRQAGDCLINWSLRPAPANDNFANAAVITSGSGSLAGNNIGATEESGEPNHANSSNSDSSVWYSWIASSNGSVTFSTFGSSFDTVIAAYTGVGVNALNLIGANDNENADTGGNRQTSRLTFNAQAGTIYKIAVDRGSDSNNIGSIALRWNSVPPPFNDNFSNSETIVGNSGTVLGRNTGATRETGEPNHGGSAVGSSVWFTWIAPQSGGISFNAAARNFATLIGVYTGTNVGQLTPISSNGQFTAISGTAYQIAVDGSNGGTGVFELNWGYGAIANDNFASAQGISGMASQVSGRNLGATIEPGEPNHGTESIWYSWTPTSSSGVRFAVNTSPQPNFIAHTLSIYSGSDISALSLIGRNTGFCQFNGCVQTSVTFNVVAGTTYKLAITGSPENNIVLSWLPAAIAGNDNFANAQMLSANTGSVLGSNGSASKELGEPNHAGNPGGRSVWYNWTPLSSGTFTFDTFGSSFDTLLAVYTGNSINALTPIASNDNAGSGTQSRVTFVAVAGTAYKIAVDGVFGASGNISLNWTLNFPPSNDNFAGAQALSSGFSGSISGSNLSATKEAGEPNHAGNTGGTSVWYNWTAPSNGSVFLTTAGSTFDTLLAVYNGNSPNMLTEIVSNDDVNFSFRHSNVQFNAIAGVVYRIAVDGKNGNVGSLRLSWSNAAVVMPIQNDSFGLAQTISGNAGTVIGSNVGATKQTGEPNHAGNPGGQSVWFRWTAPTTESVTFDTVGSAFDTLLGVYVGNAVNTLTEVASNNDDDPANNIRASRVSFSAIAGTTYNIAVDRFSGSTAGSLVLSWRPGGNILGRIQNIRGEGIENVSVYLTGTSSNTTITDALGNFSFKHLITGGNYTVTPNTLAVTYDVSSRTYSPFSGSVTDCNFTAVTPTYSITGKIMTLSGSAMGGVTVNLTGSATLTATTQPNGNYSFTDLEIGGNYTVTPVSSGFNFGNPYIFMNLSNNQWGADFRGTPVSVLQFSLPTYTVNENGVTATVVITRTGSTSGSVIVQYATVTGGTATAGQDYVATTNTLTWPNGDSANKTFAITINDDNVFEGNETVNLALSNPSAGAMLGVQNSAVLTINDNETQPTLSIGDFTQNEGNSGTTPFTFTVTLSGQTSQTVTVNYAAQDGTPPNNATAPSDYTQITSTPLTFTPGASLTQIVTVQVNGDTNVESNETFTVNLSGAVNAGVSDSQGLGTITNDDSCSYSINPTSSNVAIGGVVGNIVNVTSQIGCQWTAVSNANWIIVTGGSNGNDSGAVTYNVQANNGASRIGTITVANQTHTVNQAGLAPFDFDGDGKTDVSVFRPAVLVNNVNVGYWYWLASPNGVFNFRQFGSPGDRIAPADYDGDNKTDQVVFRPSNGYWYLFNSGNQDFTYMQFGSTEDLPVPGDYDGDGKADIAVFRPSVGTFYILQTSNGQVRAQQWGQNGDVPVPSDYDGDGKADVAVFRPSAGAFYILKSSDNGFLGTQWGANGDKPNPGDYDGDGKSDLAVFRPSTGAWYILRSTDNGVTGIGWGIDGDRPSAGDYDGDGKWDVAVFRPSTGFFYILQSQNNSLRAEQFGTNGDVPVASAYVP